MNGNIWIIKLKNEVIKMPIKKLGIVLFLLIAVIGFSCSSVNAKYENDLHMDVSIGGDIGEGLWVGSLTGLTKGYGVYDHCTGKKEWRITWLAMNNNIKMIEAQEWHESKEYVSLITWDKWGNNIDNIDYLQVEGKTNGYPIMKLYLKNGAVIEGTV
jgi:hypothetical protein